MLPGSPPLNFSGGNQSSKTGAVSMGDYRFGSLNYNTINPYVIGGVVLAAIAAWYVISNK